MKRYLDRAPVAPVCVAIRSAPLPAVDVTTAPITAVELRPHPQI